jgi:hypothetical protein
MRKNVFKCHQKIVWIVSIVPLINIYIIGKSYQTFIEITFTNNNPYLNLMCYNHGFDIQENEALVRM